MKTQIASELQIANSMIVEAVNLFNRMEEIQQQIAHRAYELFEERGREDGHDNEDWLRAESELLSPVSTEIVDTGDQLRVSAEVAGFSEKDIEISAVPGRLFISGKKELSTDPKTEGTQQAEHRLMMFFTALDLPANVDAQNVKATLKNGALKITLPKIAESESSEAKPAE